MRQGTDRSAKVASGKASRIGRLLGAVALLGSIELNAKSNTTASIPAALEAETTRHLIVISIPDRKLALMEDGQVLKVYEVAVGKSSTPSPSGEMKIINKLVDPAYHHKSKVVPPGKSNPLGDRWMGLSDKGYGIHGTNVQSSVGKAASHGCFRMRKHDVEELFKLVRVGDAVEIHSERDSELANLFEAPAAVAQSAPQAPAQPSTRTRALPSVAVMAAMADEN